MDRAKGGASDLVQDTFAAAHQARHQFASHLLVHIQAHVGQLQADVGVELVGDNGIENMVVKLRAVPGLNAISRDGRLRLCVANIDRRARA